MRRYTINQFTTLHTSFSPEMALVRRSARRGQHARSADMAAHNRFANEHERVNSELLRIITIIATLIEECQEMELQNPIESVNVPLEHKLTPMDSVVALQQQTVALTTIASTARREHGQR